jgi:hypothetical protein
MTVACGPVRPRGSSTICLPFREEDYHACIDDPARFRAALDHAFAQAPELFPQAFAHGYLLKDARTAKKTGLRLRRIECTATGEAFTIRPSFVLPYQVGRAHQVEHALYLRSFGVPYHALARIFGRDAKYWQRLELALGRNSLVGTTVRRAKVPAHLLADEHHQTRDGTKVYVATTVAKGCCLGAFVSASADETGLNTAYQKFAAEADNVQPGYQPKTVNLDGWAATRAAWLGLFPTLVVLRCFLHGWLSIRDRAKHLKELYWELGDKVWHAYAASTRRELVQRLRRLREWAREHLSGVVLEQVLKLCSRRREYGLFCDHRDGHRTSAMLDRVMREMNGYFTAGQHLHGSLETAEQRSRAWALLFNFSPWSAQTARRHGGCQSPAEQLNGHRYHDNWLQNLLVSASLAGFRR